MTFSQCVYLNTIIRFQVLSVSKRNAHVMLTKHLLTRWLPKAKSKNKPRDYFFHFYFKPKLLVIVSLIHRYDGFSKYAGFFCCHVTKYWRRSLLWKYVTNIWRHGQSTLMHTYVYIRTLQAPIWEQCRELLCTLAPSAAERPIYALGSFGSARFPIQVAHVDEFLRSQAGLAALFTIRTMRATGNGLTTLGSLEIACIRALAN